MFQIVYASTTKKKNMGSEVIDSILKKSRENNPKRQITGILLYRSEIFIQLLEGDKEAVLSLYEKIKQDTRHSNVTDIARIEGGARIFPNWDMAYRKIDDSFDLKVINEILKWNNHLAKSPTVTSQQVIKMLSYFREQIDGKIITDYQE